MHQLLSCVWLFVTLWSSSPPGSSVHEISQARILEWVAISFSRGFFPRNSTHVFCVSCLESRLFYLLRHQGSPQIIWNQMIWKNIIHFQRERQYQPWGDSSFRIFKNYYWSIVDLQSCVSFISSRRTEKWMLCIYIFIHSLLEYFLMWNVIECWVEIPAEF